MGYFISSLAKRLGFLAAISMTIFVVGKIANVISPPVQAETQIPVNTSRLAAPLSDPQMARALSSFRTSGHYEGSGGSGATMQFPSPNGPVTLSARDVTLLNARYRELKRDTAMAGGEYAQLREEMRRDQMAADGWGADTY